MFAVLARALSTVLLSVVVVVSSADLSPPSAVASLATVSPDRLSDRSPHGTVDRPDPGSVPGAAEGTWQPPVDSVIVDFFRPPAHPYGPGNRGLEYATRRGQRVGAVAAGTVVFAGQVGGRLFVVVTHGAGLRSTYAYLDRITVAEGDSVSPGQRLATAATGFHLTARLDGRYIDPLPLFGWRYRVRLVTPGASPASPTSRSGQGGIVPWRAL